MKKLITLAAIVCCASSLVSFAQEEQAPNLPDWLVEFSNLSKPVRIEFVEHFNAAKALYQQQSWSACMNELNEAEDIFAGNPNVAVLRVGCLQELGLYQDALNLVLAHLEKYPNDQMAIYNLSSIYLALEKYQDCINVTRPMLQNISMDDDIKFRDLLNYRIFVCLLRLKDEAGAMAVVKGCSSLDDSPLYYMVQVALSLYKGDRLKASNDLKVAQRIFGKSMNMPAYERCLQASKMVSAWDVAL